VRVNILTKNRERVVVNKISLQKKKICRLCNWKEENLYIPHKNIMRKLFFDLLWRKKKRKKSDNGVSATTTNKQTKYLTIIKVNIRRRVWFVVESN